MNIKNESDFQKIQGRTYELVNINKLSEEEQIEARNILNQLLDYKCEPTTSNYYFPELVANLKMNLISIIKLSLPKDIETLNEILNLNLFSTRNNRIQQKIALKFLKHLTIDNQVSLCEKWFSILKKRKAAIMLIFRNYDAILKRSQSLRTQLRLFSGNHLNKREYDVTKVICFQLIYNFQKISSLSKYRLTESLVMGMNKNTERAARKLFSRKFNSIPVKLRNSILTSIILSKELPSYYLRGFLTEKYKSVSELNIDLLKKNLKSRTLFPLVHDILSQ